MTCIFCLSDDAHFSTVEHIVPESLGGGDAATLEPGLVCNKCQNYFGAKIEQVALNNYPFSHWRISSGYKTKKRKAPFLEDFEGWLYGGPDGPSVEFRPEFHEAVLQGRKTQMRFLAQPRDRRVVCRFLVKMGLELTVLDKVDNIFSENYNIARRFCRFGDRSIKWWFMLYNLDRPIEVGGEMFITEVEQGCHVFGIEGTGLAGMQMALAVPLTSLLAPPTKDLRKRHGLHVFEV